MYVSEGVTECDKVTEWGACYAPLISGPCDGDETHPLRAPFHKCAVNVVRIENEGNTRVMRIVALRYPVHWIDEHLRPAGVFQLKLEGLAGTEGPLAAEPKSLNVERPSTPKVRDVDLYNSDPHTHYLRRSPVYCPRVVRAIDRPCSNSSRAIDCIPSHVPAEKAIRSDSNGFSKATVTLRGGISQTGDA